MIMEPQRDGDDDHDDEDKRGKKRALDHVDDDVVDAVEDDSEEDEKVAAPATKKPKTDIKLTEFKRPHRPLLRGKDMTPENTPKIMQEVHHLPSLPARKRANPPKNHKKLLEQAKWPKKQTHKPKQQEVAHLRKYKDVEDTLGEVADEKDLTLMGGKQNGRFFEEHQTDTPAQTDYAGMRLFQLMKHFSQVANADLVGQGQKPEEVESTYAWNDTDTALVMSTNNHPSQKVLHKRMATTRTMLEDAAKNADDPTAQYAALKIMFGDKQDDKRLAGGKEDPDDMRRTKAARQKFLNGDVTVAMIKGKRHAEQNNSDAVHDMGPFKQAETAGTKIRCFSCGAEVGHNMMDAHKKFYCGKIYPAQTSPENLSDAMQLVADDTLDLDKNAPFMPQSQSPPAIWDEEYKADDDETDT